MYLSAWLNVKNDTRPSTAAASAIYIETSELFADVAMATAPQIPEVTAKVNAL